MTAFLSLADRELTTIDLSVIENDEIIALSLARNQLTEVPSIPGYTTLVQLNLSCNQLESLPYLELQALQHFYLNGNKISSFPSFSGLPNLEDLDVGENDLTEVPDFSKIPRLERLDLIRNSLTRLILTNLPDLWYLNVNENRLSVPPDLSLLPKLNVLGLGANCLTEIPNLSFLKDLQNICLSDNRAFTISDVFQLYPGIPIYR